MGWLLPSVALAALMGAAPPAGPGSAAGTKANVKGPTIEQIHAAPINFAGARDLSGYRGKAPGPIVRPGGGIAFEYSFPDGSKIQFGRCGVEHRCDFALLLSSIGKGGAAEVAAANEAMEALNILYGRLESKEPIRAVSLANMPGEVVVVQRLVLDDGWTAGSIHDEYYPRFVEYGAEARTALAK